jgi:predicted MFS family arabinose efflux permease
MALSRTAVAGVALSDPAAPPAHSPRYAWFVLALLTLVYSFNFMDRYVFVILMEAIGTDLRLTDTQLGLVSGFAFSAFYSVAGLLVARWADQGNRSIILPLALAAWSALTGACGLARQFFQLLMARIGVGIAESGCSPPAMSMLSDLFIPRQRAIAFGIYSCGLYLGMALGFILGGWIGDHYGWRATFLLAGLPGIAFAVVLRLMLREPVRGVSDRKDVDRNRYSLAATLQYLRDRPAFAAYMLGSALFVFVGTAVDYWGPLFMIRVYGMNGASVGLWSGILGSSAGLSGALISGAIADRLAQRGVHWYLLIAILGVTLEVPATLLFVYAGADHAMLWYCIATFFDSFYMPATLALTHRILPVRMRALASAILLLGYNLLGISGCNLAVGYLSDLLSGRGRIPSLQYAMTLTQLAVLAGVACTLYAISRLPRDFPPLQPSQTA